MGKAVSEVMDMEYENLYALLQSDGEAKAWFKRLPDVVRTRLLPMADEIHSVGELHACARRVSREERS